MPGLSLRARILIALAGYGVLAVFGAVYLALKWRATSLTPTQQLVLSGIAVAPILLAALWEHLKGVKVGQVEITLGEVAPILHVELASEIQNLEGSATQPLLEAMSAALRKKDFRLVLVNLRSGPYWWSTRLYLLAALAEEYTNIERLVFVEQDAARLFVGIAPPAAVRKALAKKFPDLERVFRAVQQSVLGYPNAAAKVGGIINEWSNQPLFQPPAKGPTPLLHERDVRDIADCATVRVWLTDALETESRAWKGERATRSLCAKILSCTIPFVPLLNGSRLEKVVNRGELATKVALSVLS